MNRLNSLYGGTLLALTLAALPAAAQTNGSNSPYSRYGFGLLSDGASAFNKGMAGTAQGMRNGTELNVQNPASYAAIDSLAFLFDLGVTLQNGQIIQNGTKTNARNTAVDYITAGFRVAPRLGMSIGLLPYSTIGYKTLSTRSLPAATGTITQTNTFSGDGGIHTLYAGLGWSPFNRLSIGMNGGFLWGSLDHTALMQTDETNASSARQVYTASIRSYKIDLGLQYAFRLTKKDDLVLGVTYGLGHKVNRTASYYNQTITSSTVTHGDTLSVPNAFELPHTVSTGLTWAHNKSLRVGVDYQYQRWSDVKYPVLIQDAAGNNVYTTAKGSFTDSHGVRAGVEYIPNAEGLRWRQRVRYRAGFAYTSSYLNLGSSKGPQHYMASLGVALPIINMYSNRTLLNLSAQYERVQPRVAGQIKENYFRLTIGLSFNERWFMKWLAE